MKTVVEFGIRGSRHALVVCPSIKAGMQLANSLVHVLMDAGETTVLRLGKHQPVHALTSDTHFIRLSLITAAATDGSEWKLS